MNLKIAARVGIVAVTALALGAIGMHRQSLAAQARQAPIFEVDPFWPKPLPNHWVTGSTIGLSVDAQDNVWTIHRPNTVEDNFKAADLKVGDARGKDDEALPGAAGQPASDRRLIGKCCKVAPPVLVYDQAGNLVNSWGGPGTGLRLARQQSRHHRRPQGQRLARRQRRQGHADPEVQTAPASSCFRSASTACTTAVTTLTTSGSRRRSPMTPPANEVYVADGYGNRRVIVFDATPGSTRGIGARTATSPATSRCPRTTRQAPPSKQFNTVHCAIVSNDGFVYVCDRVNDRIQVFRKDGTFVKEAFFDAHTFRSGSVWDMTFSRDPQQTYIYAANGVDEKINILLRSTLEVLTSFGDGGRGPGQFFGVHNLATDSKGNLYATETYTGARVQRFIYKGVGPVTKAEQGVLWPKGR